jgi:thioredoxin 1
VMRRYKLRVPSDASVQRYIESAVRFAGYSVNGIMQLEPSDFSGQHLKKGGTLTVLFAAEWCPFCRRFRPVFDSVLAQKGVEGALADLTNFENPLWESFGIEVVPTVMVFKDGVVVYRKDGILGQGLPENAMDEVVPLLPTEH